MELDLLFIIVRFCSRHSDAVTFGDTNVHERNFITREFITDARSNVYVCAVAQYGEALRLCLGEAWTGSETRAVARRLSLVQN